MSANLDRQVQSLGSRMLDTELGKAWKARFPSPTWGNDHQLRKVIYDDLGIEAKSYTSGGKGKGKSKTPSTKAEVLQGIDVGGIDILLKIRTTDKLSTGLKGLLRESEADGLIHPFFHLSGYGDDKDGGARSFRGCLAKGTKVLVIRDFISSPNGVPIEQVKEGDLVYCFDDDLKPSIRKVLWAGKTGYRKVIRLHWRAGKRKGFLDLTPEHLVRHISGEYIEAKKTLEDYRYLNTPYNNKSPKCHLLACKRSGDQLYFTGHVSNGNGIYEHRFIYQQLVGDLLDTELVHHKNHNHMDHSPDNLEKSTLPIHSSYHTLQMHKDNPGLGKQIGEIIRTRRALGLIKTPEPRFGPDNPHYLGLTKFQCLRALARNGGKLVRAARSTCGDFNSFKGYLERFGIDPKLVSLRYDKNGKYISKGRLLELSRLGRLKVKSALGHNHYRLLKLYEFYGLDSSRRWANQFGEFSTGNHSIVSIEFLDNHVDVYDLEIEEFNNFIANEICVHNSSSDPNFQNFPKHDPYGEKVIRRALLPRPGHRIVGRDYGSMEFRISACLHHDPNMLRYIEQGDDPHRDVAAHCFLLPPKLCTKAYGEFGKNVRFAGKNNGTFAQMYFQDPPNTAKGLWKAISSLNLRYPADPEKSLFEHLKDKGIWNYDAFEKHIVNKAVPWFWTDMFPDYWKWRVKWLEDYQRNGYFDMMTGFRVEGVLTRYQLGNYPIQGPAFHILLKALIKTHQLWEKKREDGWKSLIIGQIHDELTTDEPQEEFHRNQDDIVNIMQNEVRKDWDWIITPLEVEVSATPVDGNWFEKKDI